MFGGHRLAIVPSKTEARVLTEHSYQVDKTKKSETGERAALVFPEGETQKPDEPRHFLAKNPNFGVLFATVLLVVIFVTNVPMRGMWSVVLIITVFLLSIIFALAGIWETIFQTLDHLQVYINAGGYFFISSVLFGLWLLAMFVFDRQIYMSFIPGQFRVRQQIGGGEQAFPSEGMTLEKHRSDLFRHWILGLGSGDMTVKTARGDHFDLHNVLFVGRKVAMIEDLIREKAVVRGN
jgi:hypothetical protein